MEKANQVKAYLQIPLEAFMCALEIFTLYTNFQ
jgi:hypothetical protein